LDGLTIKVNQIYEEDCLSFMDRLRNEKLLIDVIVTSPPYNLSKEYGTYKDNLERDVYLNWIKNVGNGSISILKNDGSFFLNIAGRPADPTIPFCVAAQFLDIGFKLQNIIHWIKSVSFDPEDIGKNNDFRNKGNVSIGHFKPITSSRYVSDLQEYIFHFSKTGNVKLDKLRAGVTYQDKTNIGRWRSARQDKRDRGNVWFIPYPTIQKGRPHPAVFPVKLAERCITLHGIKNNMLVYDPFMGIGNTALACIRLKINYVGTEIDPRYIAIATERISEGIDTYL
jgi:site-specific DNA-methyltransferase (adenine-specific)